jgi:hypothetical protein
LRQNDSSAPASSKTRKQRLAEALRANLLRRKVKVATGTSQDSNESGDQPTGEIVGEESGR